MPGDYLWQLNADWSWRAATRRQDGSDVVWQSPDGELRARIGVVADFAVANVTAAMAALASLGHDAADLMRALSDMQPVPGRMELVSSGCDQPTVVVDYAHTPDALVKLLGAARAFCSGRLICVSRLRR